MQRVTTRTLVHSWITWRENRFNLFRVIVCVRTIAVNVKALERSSCCWFDSDLVLFPCMILNRGACTTWDSLHQWVAPFLQSPGTGGSTAESARRTLSRSCLFTACVAQTGERLNTPDPLTCHSSQVSSLSLGPRVPQLQPPSPMEPTVEYILFQISNEQKVVCCLGWRHQINKKSVKLPKCFLLFSLYSSQCTVKKYSNRRKGWIQWEIQHGAKLISCRWPQTVSWGGHANIQVCFTIDPLIKEPETNKYPAVQHWTKSKKIPFSLHKSSWRWSCAELTLWCSLARLKAYTCHEANVSGIVEAEGLSITIHTFEGTTESPTSYWHAPAVFCGSVTPGFLLYVAGQRRKRLESLAF